MTFQRKNPDEPRPEQEIDSEWPEWVLRCRKKRQQKIKDYLPLIPNRHSETYQKAIVSDRAKHVVIKAMCQQCVNYEKITENIRYCESLLCPLWNIRPYQFKDKKPE
jgi:hypothetical protein